MARQPKEFIAIAPDGTTVHARGVSAFAEQHGLQQTSISKCLAGSSVQHKGWRFRNIGDPQPDADDLAPPDKVVSAPEPEVPAAAPPRPASLSEAPEDSSGYEMPDVEAPEFSEWQQRKKQEIRETLFALQRNIKLFAENPELRPARYAPDKDVMLLKAAAEAAGIDWKHIADNRSDAEKTQDAVDRLLEAPENIFTLADDEIDALVRAMESSAVLARTYAREQIDRKRHGPKARAEAAAKWLKRLRTVKKLARWARTDVPDELRTGDPVDDYAIEMTRTLRYMAWVGRSDIGRTRADRVFRFGKHSVKMCMDTMMARAGECFSKSGVIRSKPGMKVINYAGAQLMYPPRHSKTSFIRHFVGEAISRDYHIQIVYIHAKEGEALAFQGHVNILFDPEKEPGQRNRVLYQYPVAARTVKNLRLLSKDPPKDPNLTCCGIDSQSQGKNVDILVADDIVSQDDQESPTERERKKRRLRAVWFSRFQGQDGFFLLSGYPYHHHDAVWSYHEAAVRAARTNGREGTVIRLSKMAVGGPKTNPPFSPIWPEMYGQKWLRQTYRTIHDTAIWSANWMLQPITDEMRIIRKVALYDIDSPEHRQFLLVSRKHLSLDPAFTQESKSDKAGIVWAGLGNVDSERFEDDGRRHISWVRRIRLLGYQEIQAAQAELSQHAQDIATRVDLDMVHYEAVGGSHAMGDLLKQVGIERSTPHPTGPRSKERRLRAVAPMLEADATGLSPPVVEFPARKDAETGGLVLLPEFKQLVDYIVNFRVSSGYHGLDALTQLLKYWESEAGIGRGEVSRQVAEHVAQKSKIAKHLESLQRKTETYESAMRWNLEMVHAGASRWN